MLIVLLGLLIYFSYIKSNKDEVVIKSVEEISAPVVEEPAVEPPLTTDTTVAVEEIAAEPEPEVEPTVEKVKERKTVKYIPPKTKPCKNKSKKKTVNYTPPGTILYTGREY